ncbi:nitrile hydratase accessory protein [Halomarina halobia]|uniref:Nitrile hydratase accessory protein n=1 Tax=Halomarina halobia TaxID=3033386 RepID=A0ABD6AEY0_9EURY|nr:nitrile hydratase accessory protein [Halomarina sp. PSR21]
MTDDTRRSDREGAASAPEGVLPPPPTDTPEPTFEAPWQARAFALAVALSSYDADVYSWKDFQRKLVEEVQSETDAGDASSAVTSDTERAYSESTYYEQWLRALERVLLEAGLVAPDEVRQRVRAFADGDRDASEFVEGDHGHDHAHPHDRPHADGHDRDHAHGGGDR